MPFIASASTIDFPHKITQQEAKQQALEMFSANFPEAERLIFAFDNTEIHHRNLCKPLDYYRTPNSFEERNNDYIRTALEWSIKAIKDCVTKAGITKDEI